MNSTPACEFATETMADLIPRQSPRRPARYTSMFRNAIIRAWLRWNRVEWHGASPAVIGKLPHIEQRDGGTVVLGSRCSFGRRVALKALAGGAIRLGSRVFVNDGAELSAVAHPLTIGDHSMIAPQATAITSAIHRLSPHQQIRSGPVTLGRNVWLAKGVMVMPGVTIGDHTVVGAGSIVTRDLPEKCFAAGVPARVVHAFECPDDWVRE